MGKLRVTFIYLLTALFTLVLLASLAFIEYQLVNELINKFFILTYKQVAEKSIIAGCVFVVLYQTYIFLRGVHVIWKKSLQFNDFMNKAKKQKIAEENLQKNK